jgi:CRISPR-associated protein Cmr1
MAVLKEEEPGDMQQVQLTCEVVTPLSCVGADQQRAEIRSPSIRGAMRFWYRALMGSVAKDRIDALKGLEANVFGTTERESSVRVLVHPSANFPTGNFDFGKPGLRYL